MIARRILTPQPRSHDSPIHIKANPPISGTRTCPRSNQHRSVPSITARFQMSSSTESPVLAGPPGDCCVQGVKHTGVPVGRVETIAGVGTYISDPPAKTAGPTKVVLFFADVYGPLFENARLLQDYFASHGESHY